MERPEIRDLFEKTVRKEWQYENKETEMRQKEIKGQEGVGRIGRADQ